MCKYIFSKIQDRSYLIYSYRVMKDPNIEIDQETYTSTTIAWEGTNINTKNYETHKMLQYSRWWRSHLRR